MQAVDAPSVVGGEVAGYAYGDRVTIAAEAAYSYADDDRVTYSYGDDDRVTYSYGDGYGDDDRVGYGYGYGDS